MCPSLNNAIDNTQTHYDSDADKYKHSHSNIKNKRKDNLLSLNRPSQNKHQRKHESLSHKNNCKITSIDGQKQKNLDHKSDTDLEYLDPSDIKAKLRALPSPIMHDPYIRDEINQQLDQTISILFPTLQIKQYHQRKTMIDADGAINEEVARNVTVKQAGAQEIKENQETKEQIEERLQR